MTLGWKPENGGLEQKWKKIFWDTWAKQTEEWKGNDRTASKTSMRSFTLFETKNLNPLFQIAFPRIPESITVGLDAYQIGISKD